MKIGILGGTFDPPHVGHVIVAEQIKKHLNLDAFWFMPVFLHAFSKSLSPALHRLVMTQLIATEQSVSSFELDLKKTSYTIDTLRLLQKEYLNDIFYFCVGSDMLKDFDKWKEWQTLISDFHIVIYPRGNYELNDEVVKNTLHINKIPSNITLIKEEDVIVTSVSSSDIRNKIKNGQKVTHLIPEKVMNYIVKNHLYNK